ncbi:hypothetical protein HDU84_009670 [Entophlyctis sp. JEL0112]|nr:hypothetical protein HDU84_009670 [Entophlyctis sp. JEL0112]
MDHYLSGGKQAEDDEFADFDLDLSGVERILKATDSSKSENPQETKLKSSPISGAEVQQKKSPPSKGKKRATVFIDDDDEVEEIVEKPHRAPKKPAFEQQTTNSVDVAECSKFQAPDITRGSDQPASLQKAVSAVITEASKKANYMKILAKKSATAGPSAPGSKDIPVGEENCLLGLTFVFTGELSSISRDDAQDLVKRYGGRVTTGVSGKTSYVVVGEEAGQSKLAKAESLKIKTLAEDELLDLIRNSKRKQIASNAKKHAPAKAEETPKDVVARPALTTSFYSSSANKGKMSVDAKEQSSSSAEARSHRSCGDLWTTKYKPTRYEDVLGNRSKVERLANWLKNWNASAVAPKPSTAKDDPGNSRAVLISGPPGIGKTTAAHLVAKTEGFEIIEFNASDTRSKKAVGDAVKELTGSHTLAEYYARTSDKSKSRPLKHQVLIMDEVDGMSGSDRGGIAELISVIKNSKIPIICICNDRQSPKVKSLVNHCYDMRFARPKTNEVEKAIKNIAQKEGLDIKFNAMDTLVKSTHADIRQILNMLSTYALQSNELSFDQSRELWVSFGVFSADLYHRAKSSEKNMSMGPWDIAGLLFNRSSFRELSFPDKLELYFHDFSLVPLMIQENYIRMDPTLAHENGGPTKQGQDLETLSCLSQAADAIAYGDIISSVQMKTQNWGLLPFHGVTSTVRPAFFSHGSLTGVTHFGGGYAFPGWLGKNSTQGKNARLLKEIQLHVRLHVSADKNEVRQSYIPVLAPLLTVPMVKEEQNGINQVIKTMDDYYLTREDWESILDLGLEECGTKQLTAGIAGAVKSAFTRTYNKGNHPKPFMTTSLIGKVAKTSADSGSAAADLEDVLENDDDAVIATGSGDESANGEEDDDAVTKDRLIKQKNTTTKGKGASVGKRSATDGTVKAGPSSKRQKK